MTAAFALLKFTAARTLFERRIWMTVLVLAGPAVLILVIRWAADLPDDKGTIWHAYHGLAQFLLVMVGLPLVCMVHGTSLISAEVESRTWVYVTSRRMRRWSVLLVRFLGTAAVLAILCDLGMLALHLCTFSGLGFTDIPDGRFSGWDPTVDLRAYLTVIPLGVFAFLAVFTFFGLVWSKPLALSINYLIFVELGLGNVPVSGRVYTLMHSIRQSIAADVPRVVYMYELNPPLDVQIFPPGVTSYTPLVVTILLAVGLSAALVTWRELLPARVSPE